MPWVDIPIWHGTTEESSDLAVVLEHNCQCEALKRRCPVHQAMLDQRWLNGLLFARHILPRLRKEEFSRSCMKRSSSSR